MRSTTYERYLERISALIGIPRDDLQIDEEEILRQHFNSAIREIWNMTVWPQVCVLEARTPASQVIDFEQADETKIDAVFAVFDKDPDATESYRQMPFRLTSSGIKLTQTSTTDDVYVFFRKRCPDFAGDDYAATTAYAIGDQVYYPTTGNFYVAIASTTGNAPTDTDYWEALSIPYDFLDYCSHHAYANWLRTEGQNEKAAQQAALSADRILATELDKLERQQNVYPYLNVITHLSYTE